MQITSIQITRRDNTGTKLKATASIVLDDMVAIHDIKVHKAKITTKKNISTRLCSFFITIWDYLLKCEMALWASMRCPKRQ